MKRTSVKHCAVAAALAAAVVCGATPASAQVQWVGRGIVTVGGGLQTSSRGITTLSTQDVYDEQATFRATQEIESGPVLDLSGGIRVWRNLLVGVGYSRYSDASSAELAARIPHPLVFDAFREVNTTAGDFDHAEDVLHFIATWMVPVTNKIEASVFGGPSVFTVKQAYVSGVGFSETAPPFTEVSLDAPEIVDDSETAVGFNLGADVTYLVTPRIGVNLFGRYTGATAKFEAVEGGEIKAGGPQFGVRLRFQF